MKQKDEKRGLSVLICKTVNYNRCSWVAGEEQKKKGYSCFKR